MIYAQWSPGTLLTLVGGLFYLNPDDRLTPPSNGGFCLELVGVLMVQLSGFPGQGERSSPILCNNDSPSPSNSQRMFN